MRYGRRWVLSLAAVTLAACSGAFSAGPGPDGGPIEDASTDSVVMITPPPDGGDAGLLGDVDHHDATMIDAGGGCAIAGTTYASGTANPTNACQACQPSVSTSAWSDLTDGTSCGSEGICHTGACVSGCEIGGVYYAASAPDPNNPCQICQPATSTSAWTGAADGAGCGNNQVCASGQCGTQCDIGGTVYLSGAANPSNACQSCQPGTSTSAWTGDANGTSCASSEVCNAASCVSGCYIGGTFYAPGVPSPATACQTCQPGTSTTSWTNAANGTSCGTAEVCIAGGCVSGCTIGGNGYASGAANPANACQTCQPGTSSTAWTNLANGATCGPGEVCDAVSCVPDCYVGGTFYASGTVNTANACQSCQPGTSTSAWTDTNGASCGSGKVCNGATCAAGCFIGGVYAASGAASPMNSCQSCQPGTSTTAWTDVAGGTSCNGSGNCLSGACIPSAVVQSNGGANTSTLTFAGAQTTGNSIVVAIFSALGPGEFVADTSASTYTQQITVDNGNGTYLVVWTATGILGSAAGANTVTVDVPFNVPAKMYIAEYNVGPAALIASNMGGGEALTPVQFATGNVTTTGPTALTAFFAWQTQGTVSGLTPGIVVQRSLPYDGVQMLCLSESGLPAGTYSASGMLDDPETGDTAAWASGIIAFY